MKMGGCRSVQADIFSSFHLLYLSSLLESDIGDLRGCFGDDSELGFVLGDVVGQGVSKSFCMLWRNDDARQQTRDLRRRQDREKINPKFLRRVGYLSHG